MTDIKLPQHGEIWEKKPCGYRGGLHRMGWSLGAGIHQIDTTKNLDWGTEEQIKCGCLIKIREKGDE